MKLLKQVVLLLAIMLAMAMPVSVYAAGEGNIDNGGGGMGAGTGTNFWSSCEFPYKSRVMPTSEPLKTLKAPYMARNTMKWGFFRLKSQ